MNTVHVIRCAHCGGRHGTAREVQFCAQQSMFGPVRKWGMQNMRAAQPDAPSRQGNLTWPFRTPLAMVQNLKDGRYAVRPDSHTPYTFIRVSRPKHGKQKDCLVIQTQHSERYIPAITVYPSGRWMIWNDKIDIQLLLVAADPMTSAMNYGRELGVCSRCGKELTDERSRYYSIGPECEKYWPEIIAYVNENHGQYER